VAQRELAGVAIFEGTSQLDFGGSADVTACQSFWHVNEGLLTLCAAYCLVDGG
jgi:hypothetical protein